MEDDRSTKGAFKDLIVFDPDKILCLAKFLCDLTYQFTIDLSQLLNAFAIAWLISNTFALISPSRNSPPLICIRHVKFSPRGFTLRFLTRMVSV